MVSVAQAGGLLNKAKRTVLAPKSEKLERDQGEDRGGALAETGRGGEAGPRAGAPRGSGQAGGEGSPDVWDLIFLQEVGRKQ